MSSVYCGVKDIPKGKRRGTYQECSKLKQIRYYGIQGVKELLDKLHKIEKEVKKNKPNNTKINEELDNMIKIVEKPKEEHKKIVEEKKEEIKKEIKEEIKLEKKEGIPLDEAKSIVEDLGGGYKAVGSIAYGKPFVKDIDLITFKKLDKVYEELSQKFNITKVVANGKKKLFFNTIIDNKPIEFNIWNYTGTEYPFLLFARSYPLLFLKKYRKNIKRKGYSINDYNLKKDGKIVKTYIWRVKRGSPERTEFANIDDFFDFAKTLGLDFPFRTPHEEFLKELAEGTFKYSSMRDKDKHEYEFQDEPVEDKKNTVKKKNKSNIKKNLEHAEEKLKENKMHNIKIEKEYEAIKKEMEALTVNEEVVEQIEGMKESFKEDTGHELTDKNIESIKNCLVPIDSIYHFLKHNRKYDFKTEEQKRKFNSLVGAIRGHDFYPTPLEYGELIYNDIMKMRRNQGTPLYICDGGAGLGSLSLPFIRNGVNGGKIYINELYEDFVKLLNCFEQLEYVKVFNKNFLDIGHFKELNFVVMNPPFSGSINGKLDKKFYIYFLVKGLLLLYNASSKLEQILYIIMPKSLIDMRYATQKGELVEFKEDKALFNRVHEYFKNDPMIDNLFDYDEDDNYYHLSPAGCQIQYFMDVKDFRTLSKSGKPVDLGMTFGLYRFIIYG